MSAWIMPLTPLGRLSQTHPFVAANLRDGLWTKAEDETLLDQGAPYNRGRSISSWGVVLCQRTFHEDEESPSHGDGLTAYRRPNHLILAPAILSGRSMEDKAFCPP